MIWPGFHSYHLLGEGTGFCFTWKLVYPSKKLHCGLKRTPVQFSWAKCTNSKWERLLGDACGAREEKNYQKP